jgi:hypothetical protein
VINLCILSSFLYAYCAAFRLDVETSSYQYETKDEDTCTVTNPGHFTELNVYYFNLVQVIIEGIFLIDLGFEFILEYTDEATNLPVRDIATISLRYLKGGFIEDAIPLIPWNWFVKFKYSRIFFLIKCFRLKETFDLLDTGKFMK